MKGHWDINEEEDSEKFGSALLMAETCKDFEPTENLKDKFAKKAQP